MVDTIRGTIAGDLATLERYYTITQQGDRSAWQLTMIPTDPRMAKRIKVIEVAGRGIDVQRIRTTQANGNEDLLTDPNDQVGFPRCPPAPVPGHYCSR